jgi:transcriptional regulator with XRE-family HTH domain
MAKSKTADFNSMFAKNLREMLEKHPQTGERTTYYKLGEVLNVKPQSVSQWANGDTTPDMKHLVPMARYFGVDVNFLLTGVSAENVTMWSELGLHENSVRYLKDLKTRADKNEVNSIGMVLLADLLFRSGAFLRLYAQFNQYVFDNLEADAAHKADMSELERLSKDPSTTESALLDAVRKVDAHKDNAELIWYKSAHKSREVMQALVDRAGGFEKTAEKVFIDGKRIATIPEQLRGFVSSEVLDAVPTGEASEENT